MFICLIIYLVTYWDNYFLTVQTLNIFNICDMLILKRANTLYIYFDVNIVNNGPTEIALLKEYCER